MTATVYRGHVFTGVEEAEAVAVQGGSVVAVGSAGDVVAAAGPGTEVIDVDGLILPGFIDSHVHTHLHGEAALRADLVRCRSWADIEAALLNWSRHNPGSPRVLGRSWIHEMLDGQAPTRQLLDAVVPDRPCYLDAADYHSVWCNTAALRELGIDDATPDPVGGRIHRDASGVATGLLDETAVTAMVWPFLAGTRTEADRDRHLRRTIADFHAAGVTSVVDMAVDTDAWASFVRVADADDAPLRIGAHWLTDGSLSLGERLAQVTAAAGRPRHTAARVHTRGIKIISDGVIDGCTAALSEPYANGARPDPIWTLEELVPVMRAADDAGLAIAVHAIGDAAVTMTLDAYELVLGPKPTRPHRHRIEHLEYTTPGMARRCADLGIVVSMQPVHSDPFILATWREMLGPERAGRGFAWPEYVRAGARLCFGTDTPTAPHSALANLWIATTRRSAFDPDLPANHPEFALPVAQALGHATRDAADACGIGALVGTLAPGMAADLAILDRDPLREGPEALRNGSVLRTVIGGRVVFDRL